jgi:4-alpha-glucanotransferase
MKQFPILQVTRGKLQSLLGAAHEHVLEESLIDRVQRSARINSPGSTDKNSNFYIKSAATQIIKYLITF